MTDTLSIPERAARAVDGLPQFCRPSQLGKRLGVGAECIKGILERNKYSIYRTPRGDRRIPKNIQCKIAADFINRGWEG
jgi:hypothetical protein